MTMANNIKTFSVENRVRVLAKGSMSDLPNPNCMTYISSYMGQAGESNQTFNDQTSPTLPYSS
jgi:hypothetical protein